MDDDCGGVEKHRDFFSVLVGIDEKTHEKEREREREREEKDVCCESQRVGRS